MYLYKNDKFRQFYATIAEFSVTIEIAKAKSKQRGTVYETANPETHRNAAVCLLDAGSIGTDIGFRSNQAERDY